MTSMIEPRTLPRAPSDFEPPTVGLLGVLRILLKWSFVVAPLAALTVWIALSQSDGIEPEYMAEASVLLVGPNELILEDFETGVTTVEQINPLQTLGGTLGTVAKVISLGMADPSVEALLEADGLATNHVVWVDGNSPIVRMEAFDNQPEIANLTVVRLTEMIFSDLEELQDSLEAPESNRIEAKRISSGLVGGPDFGARTRFRLAVAAVGFALSAASAFILEGAVELWRRRKRRSLHNAQLALPAGERCTAARERPRKFRSASAMVDADRLGVVGVVRLLTGDEDVAVSVAASTEVAASENWSAIRSDNPVEWLYGEAVRQAADQPVQSVPDADNASLWARVQSMPFDMQKTLALSSIGQLTDDSIATALDMDVEVVKEHRLNASLTLAASIDSEPGDPETGTHDEPDNSDDRTNAGNPDNTDNTDNTDGSIPAADSDDTIAADPMTADVEELVRTKSKITSTQSMPASSGGRKARASTAAKK